MWQVDSSPYEFSEVSREKPTSEKDVQPFALESLWRYDYGGVPGKYPYFVDESANILGLASLEP